MHSSNINSPVGNPNLAAAKGKSVVFKSAVSALSVLAATSAMVATTVIAAPEVSLNVAQAAPQVQVELKNITLVNGSVDYGDDYVLPNGQPTTNYVPEFDDNGAGNGFFDAPNGTLSLSQLKVKYRLATLPANAATTDSIQNAGVYDVIVSLDVPGYIGIDSSNSNSNEFVVDQVTIAPFAVTEGFVKLDTPSEFKAAKVYDGNDLVEYKNVPLLWAGTPHNEKIKISFEANAAADATPSFNPQAILAKGAGVHEVATIPSTRTVNGNQVDNIIFSSPNYVWTGTNGTLVNAINTATQSSTINPTLVPSISISQRDVATLGLAQTGTTPTYNSLAKEPGVAFFGVDINVFPNISSSDYQIRGTNPYTNNTDAGKNTASAVIVGNERDTTGSVSVPFSIAPKQLTVGGLELKLRDSQNTLIKEYNNDVDVPKGELSKLELKFKSVLSTADAFTSGVETSDLTASLGWNFSVDAANFTTKIATTVNSVILSEIWGQPQGNRASNYVVGNPTSVGTVGSGLSSPLASAIAKINKADLTNKSAVVINDGTNLTVNVGTIKNVVAADFAITWWNDDNNPATLISGQSSGSIPVSLLESNGISRVYARVVSVTPSVNILQANATRTSPSVTVSTPAPTPTPEPTPVAPGGNGGGGGGSSTPAVANTISKLDVAKAALTSGASTASSIAKTTKAAIKEVSDDASAAASRTKKLVKAAKTPEAAAAVVTGALAGGDGAEVDAAIAKAAINNATSAKAKAAVIKAIIKATPSKVSPAKTAAKLGKGYGKITVPKSTKQGKTTTVTFKTGYRNGDTVVIYGYQANGKRTKLATGVILNNKVKVSLPKAKGKLTVAAYNVRNGKLIATTSTTEK